MKINPLLLANYKECAICDKKMAGIMDYTIRVICRECGGSHIPCGKNEEKARKEARR